MPSDRVRFERALRKWDAFHDNNVYSAPAELGAVAILCSDHTVADEKGDKASQEDIDEAASERRAFYADAYRIAEMLSRSGSDSQIYPAFTCEDAIDVLTNPSFSSVITIGNGNLSEVWAHQGVAISWDFIADNTSHLKTGYFIQRQCGHVAFDLSVPLGTFALADHSNVFAALDKYLPPVLTSRHEVYITQLHDEPRLGLEVVKRFFSIR